MSVLERLYFFHEQISAGRYPGIAVLMDEFEVSRATAHRDIAYLKERLLAPLAFDRRRNGYYYTDVHFQMPFVDSPRLVFFLAMLHKIGQETGLGGLNEIDALKKRLGGMLFVDHGELIDAMRCEWVAVEHPAPAVFSAVVEALLARRQLRITHQAPGHEVMARTVEPELLYNYQGGWYLRAWCTLRDDHRMFHLARISAAELGEAHSRPPTPSKLDESFGIFKGSARYWAVIRFTGTAAALVKNQLWHKDQRIDHQGDDLIMSLPVADDRELIMKIMQYGAQARVLAPVELAIKIKDEARRMLQTYDATEEE
jgi:predicted DNA-binding transcriptional regulator YafY